MEKIIEVKRVQNDVNGNPIFEVDTLIYPELKTVGRKKRNLSNIRRIQSYNIEYDLRRELKDENIKIIVK